MDGFGMFILMVALATIVFVWFGSRKGSSSQTSSGTAQQASTNPKQQMVEDIKLTKTSRVVDEVSILEELSATSPNFRQYCELVGMSQPTGGVTAPYSRKQVAYYEIRCYRIENNGKGEVETLVAHERSFDPFYFKDASCDTPVYVNIDSFGENVILINSTNHIEGPNSDFAKAVGDVSAPATESYSKTSSSGSTAAHAIVAGLAAGTGGFIAGLRERLSQPGGVVLGPQLAFAGVGPITPDTSYSQEGWAKNLMFAQGRSSRSGGSGGSGASFSSGSARKESAGRPSSSHSSSNPQRTTVTFNMGGPGFGAFMGMPTPGGFSSVPRPTIYPRPYPQHTYHRVSGSDVLGDMITSMVLSTVLDSMASTATTTTTTPRPTTTFLGYRLVEDVVPLNSPVYCIGEIYYNGTDVYMGRSLAADYPTSFFATKPEAEVLLTLGV